MKYDSANIEGLSCAAIDAKPIDFDWSDHRFQAMWESHEASTCEKCGVAIVSYGGDKHCNIDNDVSCDGHVPDSDGPMMNYAYPLPEARLDVELAAIDLVNLPVCVITHEDEENGRIELALTGGGMDLSWEICEAYMRLGYLPPVHFELPGMAGRGTSAKDKWILAGYLRSCKVAEGWARRKAERVRELVKQARKEKRK